jgi:hypothetical protein
VGELAPGYRFDLRQVATESICEAGQRTSSRHNRGGREAAFEAGWLAIAATERGRHDITAHTLGTKAWNASPVLGLRNVRQTAEYYRHVLGFDLDPVDGVFQPSVDEPGGGYAI